jgi:hypothetical protein
MTGKIPQIRESLLAATHRIELDLAIPGSPCRDLAGALRHCALPVERIERLSPSRLIHLIGRSFAG